MMQIAATICALACVSGQSLRGNNRQLDFVFSPTITGNEHVGKPGDVHVLGSVGEINVQGTGNVISRKLSELSDLAKLKRLNAQYSALVDQDAVLTAAIAYKRAESSRKLSYNVNIGDIDLSPTIGAGQTYYAGNTYSGNFGGRKLSYNVNIGDIDLSPTIGAGQTYDAGNTYIGNFGGESKGYQHLLVAGTYYDGCPGGISVKAGSCACDDGSTCRQMKAH